MASSLWVSRREIESAVLLAYKNISQPQSSRSGIFSRQKTLTLHYGVVLSNILKKSESSSHSGSGHPAPLSRSPIEESNPAMQPTSVKEIKSSTNSSKNVTVLTAETEFHGTLGFSGDLEMYGRLEGSIESETGLLTLSLIHI